MDAGGRGGRRDSGGGNRWHAGAGLGRGGPRRRGADGSDGPAAAGRGRVAGAAPAATAAGPGSRVRSASWAPGGRLGPARGRRVRHRAGTGRGRDGRRCGRGRRAGGERRGGRRGGGCRRGGRGRERDVHLHRRPRVGTRTVTSSPTEICSADAPPVRPPPRREPRPSPQKTAGAAAPACADGQGQGPPWHWPHASRHGTHDGPLILGGASRGRSPPKGGHGTAGDA